MRWLRSDRGSSVAMEVAIIAPILLLMLSVAIFAGRMKSAGNSVEQAAADAARAASISRSSSYAKSRAQDAAQATLAAQGIKCSSTSSSINTSGFNKDPGQSATVKATVTCEVPLSDLAIPGLPGSKTVTASAVSPLDTYRER